MFKKYLQMLNPKPTGLRSTQGKEFIYKMTKSNAHEKTNTKKWIKLMTAKINGSRCEYARPNA